MRACLAGAVWLLLPAALSAEIAVPDCPEAQKLCLQADRDGGVDFKAGTAFMQGNVAGILKQHDLKFRAEVLRAYRNERGEWTRLELDQQVEMEQPERHATGDHGVIENDTGTADFTGNVTLTEPFTFAEGETLHLERDPARSVLTGVPGRRVFMRHEGRVPIEDTDASYTSGETAHGDGRAVVESITPSQEATLPPFAVRPGAQAPSPRPAAPPADTGFLPDTLLVTSDEAIYERDLGQAHFTGNVVMNRREMGWRVWGEKVDLEFAEDQRLIGFHAVGNVRIEQPGRVMTADEAQSQNEMDTIVLTGNARATQAGQFDLASDRLEVYTHVEQGVVQSEDRQRPIRLTLDVGTPVPYRLSDTSIGALRAQGLPAVTLDKLGALRGREFPNRTEFLTALNGALTPPEAELYRDAIAESARAPAP